MAANNSRSSILQFALIFLVVYVGSNILLRVYFPNQFGGKPQVTAVSLTPATSSVSLGNSPTITLNNGTASGITLPGRCPNPPLDLFRVSKSVSGSSVFTPLALSGSVIGCAAPEEIHPGGKAVIDLNPWKNAFFAETGTVEARLPSNLAKKASPDGDRVQVVMHEPNAFTKLFRAIILKPFLNFLILVASVVPGHSLGIAIIVLTLVVKILLFVPTQHSMEGQKKMQMLQPKLEELKKKYPNDPKKQQEETMKLWKEHNINPFSSCLPLVIQFPVLIGLLYVIRDATHLDLVRHLIYPVYQNLSWSFDTQFLWLDLLKPEWIVLPITLVVLQFLQMKLTFAIQKKKTKSDAAAPYLPIPALEAFLYLEKPKTARHL
jgi:YidC/Oxa1 family membrane protein insertase